MDHAARPPHRQGDPELAGARHRRVDVGEVQLHVAEMGEGPLVLLLHGFPEFWWSWRHQLTALASAGFHAVAPDLRGYNLSDQPQDVAAYALPRLSGDVAGLVEALGATRAVVAGHDWGGVVAWDLAARHPERVDRLAILNAPHPAAMRRALRSPGQLLRSSYMLAFQVPAIPERLLLASNGALLRRMLRAVRAHRPPEDELDAYVAAALRGGSLRGGLNYYRAAARRARAPGGPRRRRGPVEQPVLVIWGERDPALRRDLAAPPPGAARDVRVVLLPDASHDVQLDAPEDVSRLLCEFASAGPA